MSNKLDRPDWDDYYMTLAYLVAQRSFDTSTKCGCVIVSKDNRVLATGYNGPIKGSDDEKIPMTRPDKYPFMIHAEENALLAYCGSYQDIQESICYVTSRPCHKCLRMLLQKGITQIYYGSVKTKVVDVEDLSYQEKMLTGRDTDTMMEYNLTRIKALLKKTSNYIKSKTK